MTLWERLGETLGATFLNQYGRVGEEAFKTWSLALSDLEPKQIETGFINFIKSADRYLDLKLFRALCLDLQRFGLPDADRAYMEAAMHCHDYKTHNWSHNAVLKTLLDVGVSTMRELPEDRVRPLFAARYKIVCDNVIAGKPIDIDIPKSIPAKIPNFLTKEENQERMKKLREEMGL